MFKRLLPNLIVDSVFDITPELLLSKGMKGLLLDIDDTLVAHGGYEVNNELYEWLKKMKENGIEVMLISNNTRKRVSGFAKLFDLPYISRSFKPFTFPFNKAKRQFKLKSSELCMVGDQIFMDVLGANNAKVFSVLITPLSTRKGITIKARRFLEKPIIKRYYM
jgi:HAD superfamily phosphatase (TIGR01668 family)